MLRGTTMYGASITRVLERYIVLRGTTMYGASITRVLERYGSFRARFGSPLEHHRA